MEFMSTVMASRFPSTNNQLRTSSNPRNQATIQDGKVTVQQVQGRQGQSFAGTGNKGNGTSSGGNNVADPRVADGQATQTTIPHNVAFQTDDLNAYDSDYILSEVPQHDTYRNDDMINQSVKETQYFEQSLIDYVPDNEITSDSNIISYEQYLQQTQNAIVQDTNSSAQQDSMIIFMFEQMSEQMSNHTLSKQVKEKESFLQTFTIFKKESKEKENKYMDKEIDLENKIKELDNIVYKVGQSAQTVHMLTKPQVFYDDTHKQALGYQNPFYLKKAQRIKPTLHDGIVISKKHDVISVVDEEETLILEEDNFGKRFVPQMQLSAEQAFWLPISNLKSEQLVVTQTPVEIEVPKELPKVVHVRTTPDAITEGSWGFKHTKKVFLKEVIPFINSLRATFKDFDNGLHSELNEVKMDFNQMEMIVEQCSVDKKINIQKKELSLDIDRLLDHIICQDFMNIMMHDDSVPINVLPANNKCLVNDNLEIE
ncbi:hypothetical protein Tco_0526592 [Tanacetum coccineum]